MDNNLRASGAPSGSRPTLQQLDHALEAQAASRLERTLHHPVREIAVLLARTAGRLSSTARPARATTFWGDRMEVFLPEPVSLELFRFGYFDRGLTSILLRYLRPGDVFFDVGAHFGYFSLLASSLVGPEGRVLAFEPTPSTFGVLERNLLRHPNASAFRIALHAQRGRASFSDFGVRYSAYNSLFAPRLDERNRRRARAIRHVVETWAVDDFVADRGVVPDFVKIDAESAEYAVLRGMRHTVERRRPLISLEVGDFDLPNAPSSRTTIEFLLERGYEALEFRGGQIVPHSPRDRYDYTNLFFIPRP